MKVDRVRANHSLRLTASQGTPNIPFHWFRPINERGKQCWVNVPWRLESRNGRSWASFTGRFLILGRAVLILPGIKRKKGRVSQAVTKDLSSSSKFSGSCVLTLQTLPKRKRKEGASVLTRVQDPLKENFCYNRSCWGRRRAQSWPTHLKEKNVGHKLELTW